MVNQMIKPTTKPQSNRQPRTGVNKTLLKPTDIRPVDAIQNGWQTLHLLHLFRGLEPVHVSRMFYLNREKLPPNKGRHDLKSGQQAANRETLRLLKNRGLVTVYHGLVRATDKRTRPIALNVLTKDGHQTLRQHLLDLSLDDIGEKWTDRGFDLLTGSVLNHWQATTNAAAACIGDYLLEGWNLVTVLDNKAVQEKNRVKGNPVKWPVEPDTIIILEKAGEIKVIFIEADRGGEGVNAVADNSIRAKISGYRDFFVSVRKADPLLGHLKQPTVHFLVKSDRRLASIKAQIEKQGGQQAYWLTLHDWVHPPYLWTGAVWQVCGREGYQSPLDMP